VLLIIRFQGCILVNVCLADSILECYDHIVMTACRLESVMSEVYISKGERSISLITVVCRNRPKFEAARFFALDKTTLLKILYSIVTFLLVIIQLKSNL
jgi:hypothetical protein